MNKCGVLEGEDDCDLQFADDWVKKNLQKRLDLYIHKGHI